MFFMSWFTEKIIFDDYSSHREQLEINKAKLEVMEQENSGKYICSYNYYDCEDFSSKAEAQAMFEKCGGTKNDIHYLDGDDDGIACELLS